MSRIGSLMAVIIAASLVLSSCGDSSAEYLQQGDTYYDRGQFVEAIAE
jgi:hypothetical protein